MSCCAPPPRRPWWPLAFGAAVAAQSAVVALAINLSPPAAAVRRPVQACLALATAAVVALLAPPLGRRLVADLRAGRLGQEALFALALGGAAALSARNAWRGAGPVYFEVVSLLLVIYGGSQRLKAGRRQGALAALRQAGPAPAAAGCLVAADAAAAPRWRPLAEVGRGAVVHVLAGSAVPVDGTVRRGRALLATASLSGEDFCAVVGPGDAVQAGSFCLDATLRIEVGAACGARAIDKVATGAADDLRRRAAVEVWAERVAARFAPWVGLAAAATGAWWWPRAGAEVAFAHATAVLLVACPCAFGMATPLALWTAVLRLQRLGAVPRDTAAIERLAAVDCVAFDKTGTLSAVVGGADALHLAAASPHARAALGAMLAAAQRACDHPVARALAPPAAAAPRDWEVTWARLLPAVGLEARLAPTAGGVAVRLALGHPGALVPAAQGAALAALQRQVAPTARQVAVLVDGRLVALAALEDRPWVPFAEIAAALAALRVDAVVLSGDTAGRTAALAGAAGHGGLGPAAKRQRVAAHAARGRRLCFVGDGLNDAWAMAHSHVGVAVAGAAALTAEVADVVLPAGHAADVVPVLQVAQQTLRAVRRSVALAVGYNVAGMAVAASGHLDPLLASLLMLAASLTVTGRSLALLQRPPPGPAAAAGQGGGAGDGRAAQRRPGPRP